MIEYNMFISRQGANVLYRLHLGTKSRCSIDLLAGQQAAENKRVIACIGDGSFQVIDNFDMKYGDPCPCSVIALLNLDIGFLCVGI